MSVASEKTKEQVTEEVCAYYDAAHGIYERWDNFDLRNGISIKDGELEILLRDIRKALGLSTEDNEINEILKLANEEKSAFRRSLLIPSILMVGGLEISKKDRVLDAGSGFGGTSFYIAQKTGAPVTGVDISSKQLEHAQDLLKKRAIPNVQFQLGDLHNLPSENRSFSVVIGIESVCNVLKENFIKEAARVLESGGRIAIVDTFCNEANLSNDLAKAYNQLMKQWCPPDLLGPDQFRKLMEDNGFKCIHFFDLT
ncbi:MAG: class I SAM-dependent methyltransferase, partial [Candidatus Hodarchaeota archaeon]